MRHCHRFTVLAMLAGLVVFAVPSLATDFTVQVTNAGGFTFQPDHLVVNVGDRVNWRNRTTLQHTSTSGTLCTSDGKWDTGFINPNTVSAFVTFNTQGVFPYFCVPHCVFNMVGTIEVLGPVSVTNKTWGGIKALYREPLE